MATGGQNLSSATCGQNLSSEEAYDFNCTPCLQQQERFAEAKRFCVECGEYFCSSCLSYHEKFGLTKGHKLVKCENVSSEHVQECLRTCEIHTDKREDMVCCDHDVVCCPVCVTENHSLCQNIDYLPELARKFRQDGKRVELNNDLDTKVDELKEAHKECIAKTLRLKTRKAAYLKRLEIAKKHIDNLFEIVNRAEKDVENKCGSEICCMQERIQKYNKLLSRFNCLPEDKSNENNDIAEYMDVLEQKRKLREIQIEARGKDDNLIDNTHKDKILEAANKLIKDDQSFGTVTIANSNSGCDTTNVCVTENDSSFFILLADFYGKKIKCLNRCFKEVDSFDVKGKVWGLCEVKEHTIAFTLPEMMKVQFLSTDNSLTLVHSFPTTNLHCRGIACFNKKIYVVSGGWWWEERGQLSVFDLAGKLLCTYDQDLKGRYFSSPRCVIVNTEGIYVTDQQNGLICLDLEGKRKWVCRNSKCKFTWGICFTPKGNLFVSGLESNNIVIISKDGEFLGEILNGNDGLSAPKALTFDKRNHCLIVSESKKPHLKMYDLGACENEI